jgi:predicted 3-demethylubiquinone-9 3-methyltransferase (glyoxalase superfamily)
MSSKVKTFLMFEGNAEAAVNCYVSMISNSKIISLTLYQAGQAGAEGTVAHVLFTLDGQEYMATDSYVKHEFSFTPSMSLFLETESEEELLSIFSKLSENGKVLMPLDNYGFSKKFAWLNDQYGVSWQLNLS